MKTDHHTASNRQGIAAWCFYDWANSAFPTVITTFIFAAYFTQSVAVTPVEGTILWSRTLTVAGLIVAFFSPILGAIADFWGPRKPWLLVFSILCILPTGLLWFIRPTQDFVIQAIVLYAVASIAYQFAIVFYDSMLPSIAPDDMLGRISGWGWAAGYAGGLFCLAGCLWLVQAGGPDFLGLNTVQAEPIRATAILVALWFAIFTLPILFVTPDRPATGLTLMQATHAGLRQLPKTFALLQRNRSLFRFLLAHMIYTDGLVTLFAFGGIYAAAEFAMKPADILVFGIVLNISAGIGAVTFAWLDDMIGSKSTIMLALIGLISAGISLVLVTNHNLFWIFAATLGLFVGPVQAAGRSMMARLAPDQVVTEMFGLYALAGKATSFAGPLVLGLAVQWTGSHRAGIATIVAFLLCGLMILRTVEDPA